MSITLTQRVNEINIDYVEQPKFLTIRYSGSFIGQILGNTKSNITSQEIDIEFLDDIPEVFMIYKGNVQIIKILAKNGDLEPIKDTSFVMVNDEVQMINAQWDSSTQKWEDYYQSNKYHRPIKTMIEYSENDVVKYKNDNNNELLYLPLRQQTMLNKIRGNYGFK